MTPVEQIKSRLSTADVVSSYIKLQRAGGNFKAVCPFHSERTPSFFVSPTRDSWHCFGCQKGGDQLSFVMEIEGVDFREALEILASRAGVELRKEDPKERNERARLFSLMELGARFYEAGRTRTPAVEEYLFGRGVKPETIGAFRIGYAPPERSGWRVFTEYALKKGYTLNELEKSGLAIHKQGSGSTLQVSEFYDRFRNRIIFPITDANGRVVAFGGRIFPPEQVDSSREEAAKYINSPQTPLYDKSRTLYAFDKAKTAIRKENACIIVEGYMDAVMAHQAGTMHTVAVSGTALTPTQLQMIKRLCDSILTAFDMDDAGEAATRRSIDLALEIGFDVKAIAISSGKDPADLVQEDPVKWAVAVAEGEHVIAYFLKKARDRFDGRTVEGKRAIAQRVFPLISRLPHEIEKAHWVMHAASQLGVREEAVWEDVRKMAGATADTRVPQAIQPKEHAQAGVRTRMRTLEERILGIFYAHRVASSLANEELFTDGPHRALFAAYTADATLTDEELRTFANRIMFEAEMLVPAERAEAECQRCVAELRRERTKGRLEELTRDIRQAEEAGNMQQLSHLVEEFKQVSNELSITS